MKEYTLTIILLLVLAISCLDQAYAQRTCGTTDHQEELLSNPSYAKWFNGYKKQLQSSSTNRGVICNDPLIIPVAVHYNGSVNTSNASCLISRALDQINVLNEDFGSYNSDIDNYCILSNACCTTYPPEILSQGTCLQFCLASRNLPSCEPTGNLIGGYAITVGQHTWPTASNNCWNGYFNIFVSDVDPPGQMNLLGLAPIGGAANPNGDGMFITTSAFGGTGNGCNSGTGIDTNGTYNMGRTGTHEAGHYFGLLHIFESCPNGDGITDTPDQSTENYGCPTVNAATCISSAENSCGAQDFFFNFMDYVNDPCMFMFTEDQAELMYATALQAGTGANVAYASSTTVCDLSTQPTYNPTYPNGCILTNPPIPDSAFEPAGGSITTCENRKIRFINTSDACAVTSWAWTFSGAGVTTLNSNLENPLIYVTQSGTLNVSLVTTNASGADPSPAFQSYTVTVVDSNDASCNDCGASFTDSGGTSGNYANAESIITTLCAPLTSVINIQFESFEIESEPNCDYDALTVYNGPTVFSNLIGNYCGSGLSNAPGGGSITSTDECLTFVFHSDAFVTESGWVANVFCSVVVPVELLSFNAVTQRKDVLINWESATETNLAEYLLERSSNGQDFNEITSFPAHGSNDHNSYEYLDVNLLDGQHYYRLKQKSLSGHFDYSQTISVRVHSNTNNEYVIYPNPASGIFNVQTENPRSQELTLSIYNRTGSLVREVHKYTHDIVTQLDLSELADGVYTLRINDGDTVQIQSIVIVR